MKKKVDRKPPIKYYLSFRDNAARVVKEGEKYYRYIFDEYKAEYDHLMTSGLYDALISEGIMIPHEEVYSVPIPFNNVDHSFPNIYKKLLPKQIGFQSYPFEWSFSQWVKAISTYLIINRLALKHGMILKDATPYNFYFESSKAIMLDTSSFSFFKNGDPWLAYRQFCSEFLSPVFLMYYNGHRWSRLTRTHISGLPLNFVSKQLPLSSWFNITCLIHIHLHSRYSNDEVVRKEKINLKLKKEGFTHEKIELLFDSIDRSIKNICKTKTRISSWQNYYSRDIESPEYLNHKLSAIKNWLESIKPKTVLDIGANTGKFSFLASLSSKQVISLESDEASVNFIEDFVELKQITNIKTVINDLSEPTPDLGMLGKEISNIFLRAKSEVVLSLAIVHHLFIKYKMNFEHISELLSKFSEKYVIVEFISFEDNKVKLLRKDKLINIEDYNEDSFRKSLTAYFTILEVITLHCSTRKLFLARKL